MLSIGFMGFLPEEPPEVHLHLAAHDKASGPDAVSAQLLKLIHEMETKARLPPPNAHGGYATKEYDGGEANHTHVSPVPGVAQTQEASP